ncbi:MAG: Fe-S cluster assembly ATPase SufC [Actinomycetota bacterium]|jgi:Fe-S cluster assembly ATP-binding protein|nr:Fe-S cluster assembly ATPase SufC [Actinomycetota bacterium]
MSGPATMEPGPAGSGTGRSVRGDTGGVSGGADDRGRGQGLVVEGLRAAVGGREVLRGIDLRVGPGEVHAVMGPNGSGKSTLSHVLMGRPGYDVLGGSVTLGGVDLLALPTWERARLGLFLAPQYPTEVPGVGLAHALAEALSGRDRPEPDRTTLEAEAERVGLGVAMLERALNVDLSGGERKRSETMQLAIVRPGVAILDEIDSGLDVDGLRAVARRVSDAVDEWGLGVLAITHYRRLLGELQPGMVHVLVGGRIVRSGGPEVAEELERSGYGPDTPVPLAPGAG